MNGFHISRKTIKNLCFAGLIVVVFILALGLVGKLDFLVGNDAPIEGAGESPTADAYENTYIEDDAGVSHKVDNDIETVLFIGVDKYLSEVDSNMKENNQHADVLMLCVMNHTTKEYSILPINRDTMASFYVRNLTGRDTIEHGQISLSHTYGDGGSESNNNTARSVEDLLYGISIDHVASFKLDAVSVLNDAVGGVELEIKDDFTAVDPAMIKGETIKLNGSQATLYIRERGNLEDSSNISRMERQQQFVSAWKDAFLDKYNQSSSIVASVFTSIQPYMVSNLNLVEMQKLAECFNSYTSNGFLEIAGTSQKVTDKGETHMAFTADEASLKALVIELFCIPEDQYAQSATTVSTAATFVETTVTTAPTSVVTTESSVETVTAN